MVALSQGLARRLSARSDEDSKELTMFGRSKNDGSPAVRGEDRRGPDFQGGPELPAASLDPLGGEEPERERFAPRPNRPAQETRAPDVRAPEVRAPKVPSSPRAGGKPDEDKTLTVGKDISLHGEIADCAKVHVDGKVEATLSKCRALIITDSGYFGGTAEVETADISGRFDGALECAGRLIIRESGRVNGEVRYGQIEIECGGEISGKVGTVDSEESDVSASNDDLPESSLDRSASAM
jgi:cytoskeletal protein CcmA (bactofilin family)